MGSVYYHISKQTTAVNCLNSSVNSSISAPSLSVDLLPRSLYLGVLMCVMNWLEIMISFLLHNWCTVMVVFHGACRK
jgi:hypothetical protein